MKLSGSVLAAPTLLAAAAAAQAQPHIGVSPALMFGCNQAAYFVVTSGTTTQIVAGVANEGIYLCGFNFPTVVNAGTVSIENSPATSCSTSISASVAFNLSSFAPFVDHVPFYSGMMAAPAGNNLCVVNSTTATITGFVYFTQF